MRPISYKHHHFVMSMFIILTAIFTVVPSCGGGGGGGGGSPGPWLPYIYGELVSLPTGSSIPGYMSVRVSVLDPIDVNSGYIIDDALISMPGLAGNLPFNPSTGYYEGDVVVLPGGGVGVSVTVYDGNKWSTYVSEGGIQFTSYPTITAPAAGASWSASLPHTIQWSGNYPTTDTFIGIGILNANDPNGLLLWPSSGYFLEVSSTETSYTIPANSILPGNGLVLIAIEKEFPIHYIAPYEPVHGAAPGSAFVVGGCDYLPVTITAP